MKAVKYDKVKFEKEEKEKERQMKEQADREDFFDKMNKNRRFQKYIIEEILDVAIEQSRNLTEDMNKMISCSPQETQNLMIAKRASLKMAEYIKNKITVN